MIATRLSRLPGRPGASPPPSRPRTRTLATRPLPAAPRRSSAAAARSSPRDTLQDALQRVPSPHRNCDGEAMAAIQRVGAQKRVAWSSPSEPDLCWLLAACVRVARHPGPIRKRPFSSTEATRPGGGFVSGNRPFLERGSHVQLRTAAHSRLQPSMLLTASIPHRRPEPSALSPLHSPAARKFEREGIWLLFSPTSSRNSGHL